MPKSHFNPAKAPSANRYGSTPQPWDALKSELEDLLGQVQDQISEYEGDDEQQHEQHLYSQAARPMSATNDLEMRRQEALLNVRTAVDRLGAKQEVPAKKIKKKKKKKRANNDLENAIAQIRASTGRMEAVQTSEAIEPEMDNWAQDAHQQNSDDLARLNGQIEGLHRSIRDLAGSVPGRDSFARIENQISKLSAEMDDHKSPQALAISDQLDGLQFALERLAELQVHQISHIEQIKAHEANDHSDERQQRIEESIRAIYEKFDTLEQSVERPNGSIETIAKGIASIARAVSDMQKRSENDQSQNILAQIENVSQRLSAMDNGQPASLTEDVKREMQGLRGQLVSALEPRFTALETRFDDFAAHGNVPGGASDFQHVTARIEEMEDRITHAIEGISTAQFAQGDGEGSPETVSMLKAMEKRLTDTLAEIRDAGSQASNGSAVSLDALQAMENRIAEAIAKLPSIASTPSEDQYDGLRAIENKLTSSLKRLEALSTAPTNAPQHAPVREAAASTPSPAPMPSPAKEASSGAPTQVASSSVARSLQAHRPPQAFTPTTQSPAQEDTPPAPRSAFSNQEPTRARPDAPADEVQEFDEPTAEKSVAQQSRESFIAAARRATVERQETTSNPMGSGGLLGRALDRFKSGKKDKSDDDDEPPAPTRGQERTPAPRIEPEPLVSPERAKPNNDKSTLSVGPEPARPQSNTPAPMPKSTLEADSEEVNKQDDTEEAESFLTRNRQPILLAASIVVIIAMTANLVLDNGQDPRNSDIPTSNVESADVSEAPRQISLTEIETALANEQDLPSEVASLTSATAMNEQNVELVAPAAPLIDTETVTASIPNSPVEVELPPMELGPDALRDAAAKGEPRAQYEVAMIFAEGKAVPKDSQEAVKWYERSAASGFAAAQYRLGTAYEHGLGVEKDLDQAKLWYLRSAEAGNRMGMHNLAALHASGPDGERDFNVAARWFEEAAKRGVLDSQFNLGMLYARGLGVSQDFAQSYKWFSIAAASGDKDASKARDDVARSLDPGQMSEIKQELGVWQPEQIDLAANYAPIGTWDKSFNPGGEIGQREVVMGVQIALSKLGFDLGTPDGMMGPKTRDAIRQFERTLGMNESGAINPRLLTVLNGQPV